jgi:hypothetical protein
VVGVTFGWLAGRWLIEFQYPVESTGCVENQKPTHLRRLQGWLDSYPLSRGLVFGGFALTVGAALGFWLLLASLVNYVKPDSVTAKACLIARKAGFSNVGIHSLRHSHGSQLLSKGVPLPTVSKRLGHSDVYTTAKIYAHALPKDDVTAAELWDSSVGKAIEAKRGQPAAVAERMFADVCTGDEKPN